MIITQGLLSTLLVTQGYQSGTATVTPLIGFEWSIVSGSEWFEVSGVEWMLPQ